MHTRYPRNRKFSVRRSWFLGWSFWVSGWVGFLFCVGFVGLVVFCCFLGFLAVFCLAGWCGLMSVVLGGLCWVGFWVLFFLGFCGFVEV